MCISPIIEIESDGSALFVRKLNSHNFKILKHFAWIQLPLSKHFLRDGKGNLSLFLQHYTTVNYLASDSVVCFCLLYFFDIFIFVCCGLFLIMRIDTPFWISYLIGKAWSHGLNRVKNEKIKYL